jgi:hypothetical protein
MAEHPLHLAHGLIGIDNLSIKETIVRLELRMVEHPLHPAHGLIGTDSLIIKEPNNIRTELCSVRFLVDFFLQKWLGTDSTLSQLIQGHLTMTMFQLRQRVREELSPVFLEMVLCIVRYIEESRNIRH